MSNRKCLLVGDGGTGKTSLINRLLTGEFSTSYSATIGYEIHRLSIHPVASSTKFILHVWDVSGQSNNGRFLEEILSGAHCAIIVFDVTSRITFNNVAVWYHEIVHACGPDIPIVIVGNKIDMPGRKIKTETMLRKFPSSIKFYDISVKMEFHIEQPFLWIAAQLLQSSNTEIINKPLSLPGSEDSGILEKELVKKNEAGLKEPASMVLPDADIADNSAMDHGGQSIRKTRRRLRKGLKKDK